MAVKFNDIVYVLSGGLNNDNPDLSLGGDPSGYPVQVGINNLFTDISATEATKGLVDFRCIYVFNNNDSDSLYETEIFINSQVVGGSDVKIGVIKTTDRQKIQFVGTPTAGSFTAVYEDTEFTAAYDPDPCIFAENIKQGLIGIGLSGTKIIYVETPNLYFIVRFEGDDNYRKHPLLVIKTNNLTGVSNISILKVSDGGPINSVAPMLFDSHTPPGNVNFIDSTNVNPIVLGTLKHGEGFPVWIRRDTPRQAEAAESDGFLLTLKGKPVIF